MSDLAPPLSSSRGRLKTLALGLFIASRMARSRRSTTLSLVTLISIIGIACGVLALTIVLAVTNGFQASFQDRILGVFPQLLVTRNSSVFRNYEPTLDLIRQTPGVIGATPVTHDEMMVAHGVARSGATVQGIELSSVREVLDLVPLMKEGSLDALAETPSLVRTTTGYRLQGAMEGSRHTVVVLPQGEPLVLEDWHTPPDADRIRFKVLDLRSKPEPIELIARGGLALSTNELEGPVKFDSSAQNWSAELELPLGLYELAPTQERLRLEKSRIHAVVLYEQAGETRSILLSETSAHHIPSRQALLRVVDLRTHGSALVWQAEADGIEADAIHSTQPGEFSSFEDIPARIPGILLGKGLADKLNAKTGAEITLVTPLRGIDNKLTGPFGMLPSSAHFRVEGIFESGFYERDSRLALINIHVSQRFMNRGRLIRAIAVRAQSLLTVSETKSELQRTLDPIPFEDLLRRSIDLERKLDLAAQNPQTGLVAPSQSGTPFIDALSNATTLVEMMRLQGMEALRPNRFQVFDWKEQNLNLFSSLELQKVVLTIFFFIIIVVGCFVVVGSQIMVVHEKTPDIAILKAMGATNGLIRLIFTLQGLFVAVVGVLCGLAVGLGAVWMVRWVDYKLDASIYLIDRLPAQAEFWETLWVALGALVCTLLTTQISAGRAAAKSPISGLRQID